MQIPIISGIYTSENADILQSYPHNMMPVMMDSNLSKGYLRPAWGVTHTEFSGSFLSNVSDRGSRFYKDRHMRVIGACLYSISQDGSETLWDCFNNFNPTGNDFVKMVNSFDYLAIIESGHLYLWDETNPSGELIEVTDSDLGYVVDVEFIDGYFMTTDGQYLVVTELNDPTSVSNLKYGSAEVDPDPIIGLIVVNNQVYAMGRYTIEAFYNRGGNLFPFARIDGSRMNRGLIGTHAKCQIDNTIYFLGSGKNESPAIWAGINSQTQKISTDQIDTILRGYSEVDLKKVIFEKVVDKSTSQIWIRLEDIILVYDQALSAIVGQPIWFTMDTGPTNVCWAYDKWYVGNNIGEIGYLDRSLSTVFGKSRDWSFQTRFIYNEGNGAIINEIELVALPGRSALGINPTIWTSYTIDGETYSQEWAISAGTQGNRTKRLCWFQQGHLQNYRIQKFRGNSDSHISIARIEAQIEGLAY